MSKYTCQYYTDESKAWPFEKFCYGSECKAPTNIRNNCEYKELIKKDYEMKDFLRIWDMFKKGTASIKDVDDEVGKVCQKDTKEESWHWPGRYKPDNGNYFKIANNGEVYIPDIESESDRLNGICCKTREEAEFVKKQREAYLELIDLLQELNEGWRPNWEDNRILKWGAVYNYAIDKIKIVLSSDEQIFPDCLHGKSRKIWGKVIDQLGEEKIKLALWGIED